MAARSIYDGDPSQSDDTRVNTSHVNRPGILIPGRFCWCIFVLRISFSVTFTLKHKLPIERRLAALRVRVDPLCSDHSIENDADRETKG
jgi:hypothetical protein